MKKLSIILLLSSHLAIAQQHWGMHPDIPKDTSFTIYQELAKQSKKYPSIKLVEAEIPAGVSAEEDVVYTSYGDRALHLDIYKPKKEGRYPGVVLVHGGGWRSGDKSLQRPMAQQLAARGYVTATVEYRLSMEALYPAAVHDVKAAIRWLRAHADKYHVDTSGIAILGCSAGGQLAALVGTTAQQTAMQGKGGFANYSNAVQAIVDIDGVLAFIHPESGEGQDKPGKPSAATLWFGGNATEKSALWQEASALNHVDKQTPPILFINSAHPRFHAGRDDMIARLDSLGIHSEVHTIPDTPHPFWLFHPWFDQTLNWVSDFLDKVLKSS